MDENCSIFQTIYYVRANVMVVLYQLNCRRIVAQWLRREPDYRWVEVWNLLNANKQMIFVFFSVKAILRNVTTHTRNTQIRNNYKKCFPATVNL